MAKGYRPNRLSLHLDRRPPLLPSAVEWLHLQLRTHRDLPVEYRRSRSVLYFQTNISCPQRGPRAPPTARLNVDRLGLLYLPDLPTRRLVVDVLLLTSFPHWVAALDGGIQDGVMSRNNDIAIGYSAFTTNSWPLLSSELVNRSQLFVTNASDNLAGLFGSTLAISKCLMLQSLSPWGRGRQLRVSMPSFENIT
jgi:hypothetical protein